MLNFMLIPNLLIWPQKKIREKFFGKKLSEFWVFLDFALFTVFFAFNSKNYFECIWMHFSYFVLKFSGNCFFGHINTFCKFRMHMLKTWSLFENLKTVVVICRKSLTILIQKFSWNFFWVIRVLILFANFECICSKHGTFPKILQTVRSYILQIFINLSLNPIKF